VAALGGLVVAKGLFGVGTRGLLAAGTAGVVGLTLTEAGVAVGLVVGTTGGRVATTVGAMVTTRPEAVGRLGGGLMTRVVLLFGLMAPEVLGLTATGAEAFGLAPVLLGAGLAPAGVGLLATKGLGLLLV
jgi:hypothetical protein